MAATLDFAPDCSRWDTASLYLVLASTVTLPQ
jgi:hypothetical protein